jgi:predicted lipid-binding transport protein (Tim44 family)
MNFEESLRALFALVDPHHPVTDANVDDLVGAYLETEREKLAKFLQRASFSNRAQSISERILRGPV